MLSALLNKTFPSFVPEKVGCGRRVLNYLLGISSVEEDEAKQLAMMIHLEKVSQLHQTKRVKIVLGFFLVLILTIGTCMYIFWSVYKFDSAPFYPMGATNETLLPGDEIPTEN